LTRTPRGAGGRGAGPPGPTQREHPNAPRVADQSPLRTGVTVRVFEEGDLNPKLLVKFVKVFHGSTAKNRHLPPPSVSGGHIHAGADRYPLCGPGSLDSFPSGSRRLELRADRAAPLRIS